MTDLRAAPAQSTPAPSTPAPSTPAPSTVAPSTIPQPMASMRVARRSSSPFFVVAAIAALASACSAPTAEVDAAQPPPPASDAVALAPPPAEATASDPLSPRAFTELYLKRLQAAAPSLDASAVNDLEVAAGGASDDGVVANLANAYRQYRSTPASLDALLDRHVAALIEARAARAAPLSAETLVACVRSRAWLESFGEGATDIVSTPIVGDLVLVLCQDSPTTLRTAAPAEVADLRRDGLDPQAIAIANVPRIVERVSFQQGDGVVLVAADGTYESSLILVDAVWAELTDILGAPLVFATPSRDLLLVAAKDDAIAIEQVKALAQTRYKQGLYAISDSLFVFENGRFAPFK